MSNDHSLATVFLRNTILEFFLKIILYKYNFKYAKENFDILSNCDDESFLNIINLER